MDDSLRLQSATADPDYWTESRRPLASLLFVLPLLAVYEAGVLLDLDGVRNGADAWLRQLLTLLGFGQYFLLPLLTVAALLGWHYLTRAPWRVPPQLLGAMYVEAAVLSIALVGLAHLLSWLLPAPLAEISLATRAPTLSIWDAPARLIGYCGAGLYEELLFRLLLVPLAMTLCAWLRMPRERQIVWSVLVTSVLFAVAHHVGPRGEPWSWYELVFRTAAGMFFAALFLFRGFGIAAGTHALYDVLVGILLP